MPAVSKGIRWSWPRLRRTCRRPWTASSTGGPRRPGGGRVWKWLRAQLALASDSGSATCWLRGLSKLLFIRPLGSGWTSEGHGGVAWVAVCAKTSTGWTCKSAMTEGSPAPERASSPLARYPGCTPSGPPPGGQQLSSFRAWLPPLLPPHFHHLLLHLLRNYLQFPKPSPQQRPCLQARRSLLCLKLPSPPLSGSCLLLPHNLPQTAPPLPSFPLGAFFFWPLSLSGALLLASSHICAGPCTPGPCTPDPCSGASLCF